MLTFQFVVVLYVICIERFSRVGTYGFVISSTADYSNEIYKVYTDPTPYIEKEVTPYHNKDEQAQNEDNDTTSYPQTSEKEFTETTDIVDFTSHSEHSTETEEPTSPSPSTEILQYDISTESHETSIEEPEKNIKHHGKESNESNDPNIRTRFDFEVDSTNSLSEEQIGVYISFPNESEIPSTLAGHSIICHFQVQAEVLNVPVVAPPVIFCQLVPQTTDFNQPLSPQFGYSYQSFVPQTGGPNQPFTPQPGTPFQTFMPQYGRSGQAFSHPPGDDDPNQTFGQLPEEPKQLFGQQPGYPYQSFPQHSGGPRHPFALQPTVYSQPFAPQGQEFEPQPGHPNWTFAPQPINQPFAPKPGPFNWPVVPQPRSQEFVPHPGFPNWSYAPQPRNQPFVPQPGFPNWSFASQPRGQKFAPEPGVPNWPFVPQPSDQEFAPQPRVPNWPFAPQARDQHFDNSQTILRGSSRW